MRGKIIIALMALVFGFALMGATARDAAAQLEITFSLKDKQVIASFFGGGGSGGGGGKTGKPGKGNRGKGNKGIPPGLAKKGGALPPGIAKRQLPSTLITQLPPPPQGFERVIVDNDILLINIATQIVHDVISDIIR
ncbi:MAG: hypothetical protein V3S44_04310 [Alphaproteobacteria bacterium]